MGCGQWACADHNRTARNWPPVLEVGKVSKVAVILIPAKQGSACLSSSSEVTYLCSFRPVHVRSTDEAHTKKVYSLQFVLFRSIPINESESKVGGSYRVGSFLLRVFVPLPLGPFVKGR